MRRPTMLTIALITICCILNLVLACLVDDQLERADDLKKNAQTYEDEAVKSHLAYEGARRDLVKAQNRQRTLEQQLNKARADARASRSRLAPESSKPLKRARTPRAHQSVRALGVQDITQYCATGNRTASGKNPRVGMVATLSRSIPFGTRLSIEGLGIFTVEDRIGHGSDFDIFTDSCSGASQFGRKHRVVTIL